MEFFRQPKAYLSRKVTFSACHRLHSNELSDEENLLVYGKCNNPNGHGHNYKAEVTLYGPVNKETGMVKNITKLKEEMEIAIMDVMDHKNLDKDVAYFENKPSTTENVAVYIWSKLKEIMDEPHLLYEVKLHETDKNVIIYRGD